MTALRLSCVALLGALSLAAHAQQAASPVETALSGRWTGVLEYRDYAEPATSTKRVQLPTWLTIEVTPAGLRFHYIYDDGPNKTVDSRSLVVLDAAAHTWSIAETEHPQRFSVAGLEKLREGRGELVLSGPSTENGKPVDERETITVRRNLLTILEETRPVGSTDAFAFRHRYVFTRAEAPAVTAAH